MHRLVILHCGIDICYVYIVFTDVSVNVPEFGQIFVDIAYGGGFYAIVPSSQFNLENDCSSAKMEEVSGKLLGNCCCQFRNF